MKVLAVQHIAASQNPAKFTDDCEIYLEIEALRDFPHRPDPCTFICLEEDFKIFTCRICISTIRCKGNTIKISFRLRLPNYMLNVEIIDFGSKEQLLI